MRREYSNHEGKATAQLERPGNPQRARVPMVNIVGDQASGQKLWRRVPLLALGAKAPP
jgi:hypothetical protein